MDDVIPRLNTALDGRYSVREEIGQGGMAVVFLAEDLKHKRNVALKVLRSELAAIIGADRFLKEIEVTANLQHPNILPLYDSGDADGYLYYVMPLMEGDTLRDRLDQEHQLPVDDAMEIAKSVASAVDYAHRNGVIHRDLKPSNILLHEGQGLVADFGIALAMKNAGGQTRLTETGLSVGTPHYMSPEQAAGDRELDARSDLYSLGALTYEMLVGEPPHVGNTAQAVVAKILSDTPAPIRRTRELVPANIEAAVTKALARSPADRFASVADFAAALSNPAFTLPTMQVAEVDRATVAPSIWTRVGPVAAALAFLAIIVAGWALLRPEPPPQVARFNLAFLPGQEHVDHGRASFDVAPRGAGFVYRGPGTEGSQLWVKHRSEPFAAPLSGTMDPVAPSISPNATEVAFVTGDQLKKVPLHGGGAITLAESANPSPAAWLDDGSVVFSQPPWRLASVPAQGGAAEEIWPDQPDGQFAYNAAGLPGSNGLLFTLCDNACANVMEIRTLDLRTKESRVLVPGAVAAWFVESGHVVYVRPDGAVFAAAFDLVTLELAGAAVPVLEGVKLDGNYPDLALTPDGTVLMMVGTDVSPEGNLELVSVSREGVVSSVDPTWRFRNARNSGFDLSPDGTRLAIGLDTPEGDDIWIKDLGGGPLLRLTYHPAEETAPRWSPDGQYVYFGSRRRDNVATDLYLKRADGAGEPLPVLLKDPQIWEHDATPDNAWIVARVGGATNEVGGRNIVAYRMEEDTAEVPLLTSEYDEVSPKLSPDGRWLAYASQETGEWEVYVRPFPNVSAGKWLVSTAGGFAPLWAHSGRELFFIAPGEGMMVATVETVGGLRITDRRLLFPLPAGVSAPTLRSLYDITPDDQEFIMIRQAGLSGDEAPPMILVENWLEEVKARMEGQGG